MNSEENVKGEILLSVVEDLFQIEGRGLIVVPGLPDPSSTVPVLRRGSAVTLRRPDGSRIETFIRELEMINRRPPVPFTAFLLPEGLTKSDIPIGTEVRYLPTSADTYV